MQLTQMGFTMEQSKKGLIKVSNESVAAAVEAIMELQASEPEKPKPTASAKNLTVVSYNCSMCTYLNPDGKAVCEVCGTAAPQTAYIVVKSEEETKKEEEEAARKKKEEEEAAA